MIHYNFGSSKDVASIAQLHAENWQKYYRGALREDYLDQEVHEERRLAWSQRLAKEQAGRCLITARQNEKLVGFAYSFLDYDEQGSYLDNLHVNEAYHGRGVGRRLMAKSAQWLIDQDSKRPYYLWVLDSNKSAIEFYERMQGKNSGTDMHTMPDGSACRCLRYVWEDLESLAART